MCVIWRPLPNVMANPLPACPPDADMKTDDNTESMLELGTLQFLLDQVRGNSCIAYNVLDLPLRKSIVKIPPRLEDISTDAYSVPFVKELTQVRDLRDTTKWGTAASKDANSWPHIDDYGLGTSVHVQTGSKLWVLAEKIQEDRKADEMGDIGAFNRWGVRKMDPKLWRLEAVHLQPNSVL